MLLLLFFLKSPKPWGLKAKNKACHIFSIPYFKYHQSIYAFRQPVVPLIQPPTFDIHFPEANQITYIPGGNQGFVLPIYWLASKQLKKIEKLCKYELIGCNLHPTCFRSLPLPCCACHTNCFQRLGHRQLWSLDQKKWKLSKNLGKVILVAYRYEKF